MFKPERMQKVSILCQKEYLSAVIEKLYGMGIYHIVDHKKTEELDLGEPLEAAEKTAELLVKIRGLISALEIKKENAVKRRKAQFKLSKPARQDYKDIEKRLERLHSDAAENVDIIKEANEKISKLNEEIKVLEIARMLRLETGLFEESGALARFIGTLQSTKGLKESLDKLTHRYEMIQAKVEAGYYIAIFIDKGFAERAAEILAHAGFSEIDISLIERRKKIGQQILDAMDSLKKETRKKEDADTRLAKLRKENTDFLLENESILSVESEKAEAPLKFGSTKKTFTIQGWVPENELGKISYELNSITNKKIYIEHALPEKREAVPIKLKHSIMTKPYEFFVKLYELPNYREIDPTILLFITFPIFFGLMLGDAGYGVITFLIFLALRIKLPQFKALLNIMMFASVITICFGLAFGEYFGFEHVSEKTGGAWCQNYGVCLHKEVLGEHGEGDGEINEDIENSGVEENMDEQNMGVEQNIGNEQNIGIENIDSAESEYTEPYKPHTEPVKYVYTFPRLFNRAGSKMNVFGYEVLSILVIGAIIGFVHLNLGFLIGFYNMWLAHGFVHAFLEKISWMVMELGVILIALRYTAIYPLKSLIVWGVFILGVAMIYLGEGVQGIVEMPAIFSNILSYMRLGAVGLASVGLAAVVNENLALPFIEKGGIYILFAALILILGHAVNIALGVIGPFLHSIRLHYVEFFTKFYKGGGIEYMPFGAEKE